MADKRIYLKDYRAPDYWIEKCDLTVRLDLTNTVVDSVLYVERNKDHGDDLPPLLLDGIGLSLLSVSIDDVAMDSDVYTLTDTHLSLPVSADKFTVKLSVSINPSANLALEGLYVSGELFCTQMEAEGFRRFTYFLDRPDVLCRFTCTLVSPNDGPPMLLSNGNRVRDEIGADGLRWVTWDDPFLKPSYLFALVAGDLDLLQDSFTTLSGRKIDLYIYCDKGRADRCHHAMVSLKKSMKWDEDVYGREYDLDLFMIVAVDDFNMGAMENKGLNIFNAAYILADPKTATDADYLGIEAVVAHEYFHNWTGNRITCRDWFQLTLKEGLTVFRDQCFSADMNHAAVQRISDVRVLRDVQFVEDAGPMAHPIQPASFVEIDNFYTATVYDKGAEIIRMFHTLLGADGFRKGMDLYFDTFDGQAVRTDDFIWSMAEANQKDFSQFTRWYHQAGTPVCRVRGEYDAQKQQYTLHVSQSCDPGGQETAPHPFYMPLKLGLLDATGRELSVKSSSHTVFDSDGSAVICLDKADDTLVFDGVTGPVIPSLFRDFSAPVRVDFDYSLEDLCLLLSKDSNLFNRYDAGQALFLRLLHDRMDGNDAPIPDFVIAAIEALLQLDDSDAAFIADVLRLPSLDQLVSSRKPFDYAAAFSAQRSVLSEIAVRLDSEIDNRYWMLGRDTAFDLSPISMGRRALKNRLLDLLAHRPDSGADLAREAVVIANNMTDTMGAVRVLCHHFPDSGACASALDQFERDWSALPLVMDKWFAVQASSPSDSVFDTVTSLSKHPSFSKKNPNKIRALYGAFSRNLTQFHHESGRGYTLIADAVRDIDAFNPSIAARLVQAFRQIANCDSKRQAMMKVQLETLLELSHLSKNTREMVGKMLAF